MRQLTRMRTAKGKPKGKPWCGCPFTSLLLAVCAGVLLLAAAASGQAPVDSDGDGLSDTLEDALLQRFRPTLMVSADDCSLRPASFLPGRVSPEVSLDDATVYGQAFTPPGRAGAPPQIELHFYHLWRRDCGRLGHPLDAEHVAVLLELSAAANAEGAGAWHATYWYAAAHEDTVCDASQMTRASTLDATDHGATVWVSSGKHASFLNGELCQHGCGGDHCPQTTRLPATAVLNLGEAARPMHDLVWTRSDRWPLHEKMIRSDFTPERLRRLEKLPLTDIAWANPAKRPVQGAILGGSTAVDGALRGSEATGSALSAGGRSTDTALTVAGTGTAGALGTAAHATGRTLGRALHRVRNVLDSAITK